MPISNKWKAQSTTLKLHHCLCVCDTTTASTLREAKKTLQGSISWLSNKHLVALPRSISAPSANCLPSNSMISMKKKKEEEATFPTCLWALIHVKPEQIYHYKAKPPEDHWRQYVDADHNVTAILHTWRSLSCCCYMFLCALGSITRHLELFRSTTGWAWNSTETLRGPRGAKSRQRTKSTRFCWVLGQMVDPNKWVWNYRPL